MPVAGSRWSAPTAINGGQQPTTYPIGNNRTLYEENSRGRQLFAVFGSRCQIEEEGGGVADETTSAYPCLCQQGVSRRRHACRTGRYRCGLDRRSVLARQDGPRSRL